MQNFEQNKGDKRYQEVSKHPLPCQREIKALVERHDFAYDIAGIAKRRATEQDPRERNHHERQGYPERTSKTSRRTLVQVQGLLDYLASAVHKAPHHERPVRAMPNAAHEERRHDVQVIASLAAAVAAQRNVHVILEPARKRYVPTPPEIRDAHGKIRVVEVVHKVKAEELPDADRHKGISGKVGINLDAVKETREQAIQAREFKVMVQDKRNIQAHPIRHGDLQEEPPKEEPEPRSGTAVIERSKFLYLRQKILRLADWPGSNLREERDKEQVIERVLFGWNPLVVHVQKVAQRLERKETHPHGDSPVQARQLEAQMNKRKHPENRLIYKVVVLEQEQRNERHAGKKNTTAFGNRATLQEQRPAKGHERNRQQQQRIGRAKVHIQEVTRHEQERPPKPCQPIREQPINSEDYRQHKEEFEFGKKHSGQLRQIIIKRKRPPYSGRPRNFCRLC